MDAERPQLGKLYYKIKDVAEMLGVQQSTLRFWEKEFDCLNPRRSATNLRYYTPQDIETLRAISYLLRDRGLKLEAAKEQMRLNRGNVSRRLRAIERLEKVRNSLEELMKGLSVRAQALGIPEESDAPR
ncbi:MAG: MerR family transcriptional regulator [Lepagella sp.]